MVAERGSAAGVDGVNDESATDPGAQVPTAADPWLEALQFMATQMQDNLEKKRSYKV